MYCNFAQLLLTTTHTWISNNAMLYYRIVYHRMHTIAYYRIVLCPMLCDTMLC